MRCGTRSRRLVCARCSGSWATGSPHSSIGLPEQREDMMGLPALVDHETGEILPAPSVTLGVIRGESPKGLTAGATEAAEELARVIHSRKLYSDIQGKRYVRCEGWTTLATMMGVLPR